jgi:hypothetical protein
MRKSWAAAVVLLLAGAGWSDARGATGWVYYRTFYYPVYTVTTVPVYYNPVVFSPAVCFPPVQPVVLAPARPVLVMPNLAVPTAAPPSQTREPPKAPARSDQAPGPKAERPPQLDGARSYQNAARPGVGPPVVSGQSRRDDYVPVSR